jgi:hypothetical protein
MLRGREKKGGYRLYRWGSIRYTDCIYTAQTVFIRLNIYGSQWENIDKHQKPVSHILESVKMILPRILLLLTITCSVWSTVNGLNGGRAIKHINSQVLINLSHFILIFHFAFASK